MHTSHSKLRMAQRSISKTVVNLLIAWGQERFERGAEIYLGTQRSVEKMIRNGIPKSDALKTKGKYVVVTDGHVITCAHKYKR